MSLTSPGPSMSSRMHEFTEREEWLGTKKEGYGDSRSSISLVLGDLFKAEGCQIVAQPGNGHNVYQSPVPKRRQSLFQPRERPLLNFDILSRLILVDDIPHSLNRASAKAEDLVIS